MNGADPGELFARTVERIRAEYLEMPGLDLTVAQAARLWSLDLAFCDVVLTSLEEARFLVRTRRASFMRPN